MPQALLKPENFLLTLVLPGVPLQGCKIQTQTCMSPGCITTDGCIGVHAASRRRYCNTEKEGTPRPSQ